MKIGIITFHYIPNIGAVLQAYALCEFLCELGYDCEIIDYRCEAIDAKEIKYKVDGNWFYKILKLLFNKKKHIDKTRACQEFLYDNSRVSKTIFNKNNIENAKELYDVFISGSDMIWDLGITDFDKTYFLDFASENVFKIAYASSGTESWNDNEYPEIKKLLSNYEAIGVREENTKQILKNIMSIDSELVVDPTLLLDFKHWETLALCPDEDDYVLVYFPYPEVLNAAQIYASKYEKKLIVIENSIKRKKYKKIWPKTPQEWLGYIKNADAIFTDSYHGLIFSLIFQKKVWTANKGSRQKTLIHKLDIDDVFIKNYNYLEKNDDFENEYVYKLIGFRDKSRLFLKKAIERTLKENGCETNTL